MDRSQLAINVLREHRDQLADSLCNAEVERRVLEAQLKALAEQAVALTAERDAAAEALKARQAKR